MTTQDLRELIHRAGGPTRFALETGWPLDTVKKWSNASRSPSGRNKAILNAAMGEPESFTQEEADFVFRVRLIVRQLEG